MLQMEIRKLYFLAFGFILLSACRQDKTLRLYNGCEIILKEKEQTDGRLGAYEQAFNDSGKLNIPFHKRIYSKEYEIYLGLVHTPLPERVSASSLFKEGLVMTDDFALNNAWLGVKSKERYWNSTFFTSEDGQTWMLASCTMDSALSYGFLHPDSLVNRLNCEKVEAKQ